MGDYEQLRDKAHAFVVAHPGCTLDDLEASGVFDGRDYAIALAFALIGGWVYSDHRLSQVGTNRYYPSSTEREKES